MARNLLASVVRFVTGVRIHELEDWTGEACVFFANHSSHLDALVIWAALPAEVRDLVSPVAARDYWEKGRVRRWISTKVFHAILLERSIYHSGETIWHSQLIKEVRRWSVNLAFLPINGTDTPDKARTSLNGFEVAALSKAISASLVIPCHYDMFDVGNIDTTEFSSCCERLNQRHRILKPGQRMTMGPMTDPTAGKSLPSEPYSGDWGLGY